jgi:hypothetical protein
MCIGIDSYTRKQLISNRQYFYSKHCHKDTIRERYQSVILIQTTSQNNVITIKLEKFKKIEFNKKLINFILRIPMSLEYSERIKLLLSYTTKQPSDKDYRYILIDLVKIV